MCCIALQKSINLTKYINKCNTSQVFIEYFMFYALNCSKVQNKPLSN